MQAKEPYKNDKFVQWRAGEFSISLFLLYLLKTGLHHVCFRLKSQEDVEKIFDFLKDTVPEHGGKIIQGPQTGTWAPGYRSVLIEDRDGIRIEWNFVPGKGLLATKDKKIFSKL